MSKDWTGSQASLFKTIGATGHGIQSREENDYYATDPKAMYMLLERETFNNNIWENAVGGGHLARVLTDVGYEVKATDLIDRGYPNTEILNFFEYEGKWHGDIITNPPYRYAQKWVEKSLDIVNDGSKVAMFLKLTFLESKGRKPMFEKYPPRTVYVFSERIQCAKNGEFKGGSAVAYAWFVWEKGFTGDPIIKWL